MGAQLYGFWRFYRDNVADGVIGRFITVARYFGMFGALGWGFGGSMSYMHVVSYTHSGHSGSVLYGFANLFVIGFLWAAMGGAGTALPAILSSEHLNLFFVPIIAIFIGWALQNAVVRSLSRIKSMQRHRSRLYWYDTDWLNASAGLPHSFFW